jgi:hypothetical protein
VSAPACGGAADRGRAAVAEAELTAFGGTDLESERSVAELAARAAGVVSSPWWTAAGGPHVDVAAARASARSSSARGRGDRVAIRLATGQHDVASLVHELAHALAGVERGHDARFRAALVDVTAVAVGSVAAASLAAALGHLGLPVATRPWPPPIRLEGDRFVVL